jgi:hypothetical protein
MFKGDHPGTLTIMSDLKKTCCNQERWKEVEELEAK